MSDGIDKLAGAIGDTLKTAPTLYEDALQPTVQEVGKFAARIPRAINAAFSGLDKWILNKEYAIDETKKLLEKKLENVNPDKIVEPEAYVAVPAIQAISYSMNSEELRNLYANLLAKTMNSDTKNQVHPSFIETIKQLSPEDAMLFKQIFPLQYRPIIDVRLELSSGGYKTLAKYCNTFINSQLSDYGLSFDNLIRLGLIEIPLNESYNNATVYNPILYLLKSQYKFEQYIQNYPNATNITYYKGRVIITAYGQVFYNICVI